MATPSRSSPRSNRCRLAASCPGIDVLGWHDGYLAGSEEQRVLDEIGKLRPDILVVARGVPLQELWLTQHWDTLPVRLGICVGGLFDFLAERYRRAPRWMQRLGIEWICRLVQDPRRLWRRYLLGNPAFVASVLAGQFSGRAARGRTRLVE